jgi:CobW/HypB/UreG, nucleotide-binding domain
VNVVSGFLGSGKTALVAQLCRDPQLANTAVIINEIGEVGLDLRDFGEAPSSSLTQKPMSPGHRQPLTAFETYNGRSTFDAGTALHAPIRSLADGSQIVSRE